MNPAVHEPSPSSPPDRSPPPGVTERVVRVNGHPPTVIRTIDLRSDAVEDAITYVFAQNVKAARAENERLTGSPDGTPALGRG